MENEATWAGTHAFNPGKYLEKIGVKGKKEVKEINNKMNHIIYLFIYYES